MPDNVVYAWSTEGKVLKTFTPTDTFTDGGTYVFGLNYSLREGNDRLAEYLEKWLQEGKVKIVKTGGHIG